MDNRRRKLILNGYAERRRRKWNAPSNFDRYRAPYLAPLGALIKRRRKRP